MLTAALFLAALAASPSSPASQIPPAIYTDPLPDNAHPARMEVLHIPSGQVRINGVAYLAAGAGPHPTIIICHGLPGNEKNLDLAQVLRRAGWNAITFNYRGSWGSAGNFKFAQNPEDARAVLAYLREPMNAEKLAVDTSRMVIAGHSMGGWVAVTAGAPDAGVQGFILISSANVGRSGQVSRAAIVQRMSENMESLVGVTPETMADELITGADINNFVKYAGALANRPVLVLTSDDGLAPMSAELVEAIRGKGGDQTTSVHVATDHGWSDRRIRLQTEILNWLAKLK